MKILILEDSGERIFSFKKRLIGHDVIYTKDTKECIRLLRDEDWDYLFLDHDMGSTFDQPGEGTGYEVAKWVAEHPDRVPRQRILLHTMNNVGASAMMMVLGRAGIRATYIPLLWEKINV